MEIHCNKCNSKLNISDDKIPKNKTIKIRCPKCKAKIKIDPIESSNKEMSDSAQFDEIGEDSYNYEDYSEDESLEFFEEDVKLALILAANDEQAEKIKSATGALGYRAIIPDNTRDALGKMRFHKFDLIFLSQGYDGQELRHSPILNYLNNMAMPSRRLIFLALMGEEFKTMDNIMAYSLSANAVINTKDLAKLTAILKKGVSEYEKFYKVYLDTLVKVGKT